MALVLTSGPAAEPVSVAEAKAHLRVDGTAEDVLISSLILTSRLHIEAALGLALMAQSWMLKLDRWPEGGVVPIPMRPVQGVTQVRVFDAGGSPTVVGATDYFVDTASAPARLLRKQVSWPDPGQVANGIEISFNAGYGAAATDVPGPIRQALLLLVAHWYEHRDWIEVGSAATAIPAGVTELLSPFRTVRL